MIALNFEYLKHTDYIVKLSNNTKIVSSVFIIELFVAFLLNSIFSMQFLNVALRIPL